MKRCKRAKVKSNRENVDKIKELELEAIFINSLSKEFIDICKKELEALLLKDYLNLSCEEAAEILGLPKATYWRLLDSARKKIAQAIVEGKNISIKEE